MKVHLQVRCLTDQSDSVRMNLSSNTKSLCILKKIVIFQTDDMSFYKALDRLKGKGSFFSKGSAFPIFPQLFLFI